MFRGSLVFIFAMLQASTVFGASKSKVKYQPPSQEEYYSTAEKGITAEARQRADELRVQTVNSIQSLLKDKKLSSSRKFELQLRLGELYAERHDYLRDQELFEFSQKHDAWMQGGKKGKEPSLLNKASLSYLAKAANAFRELVRDFPRHPRTASALYALGKTLARLNDDSSLLYFKKLIANHKNSPLVPDAYLATAEFYFEKHRMNEAVEAYKKVLQYKEHLAYPYAVYKLGWAFYNATPKNEKEREELLDKSITSFKLVIRLADKEQRIHAGRLNLREQAINDLIMVWAETENTSEAWSYFKTIDEEKSFYTLLEKLGQIYSEQGRNEKAIDVYARLLKEAPNRESNPQSYEKILALYDITGNVKALVASLQDMKKLYVDGSSWMRSFDKNPEVLRAAKKLVEFNMHRYGTLYHNRGQKAKNNGFLVAAATIYSEYLNAFSKTNEAYEIRYYLADIMYDFKKYEAASKHYIIVSNERPKDGKYLKDAAFNAVAALNKLDKDTKYQKLPPLGQVTSPIALPEVKKDLIAALENYVRLLPKEKDGHPMRYTVAQTYFEYGHYPIALKKFKDLVLELPATKQGEASAKVLVGYELEKKNWGGAIALVNELNGIKELKDKDVKKFLGEALRTSMYNLALDLEKDGKNKEAAEAFLAYQKEFSQDWKTADKALFNASNNFYKAGMLENALSAQLLLIKSYTKSNLQRDSLVQIAQFYEALAQLDEASQYYKQFAVNFPSDKLAPRALFNSAVLAKGIAKKQEAAQLFTRFVKFYPKHELSEDALLELAKVQEEAKDYKSAVASYEKLPGKTKNAERALLAEAKAASLNLAHVNRSQGDRALRSVMRKLKSKNAPAAFDARRIVGEIVFNGIEADFQQFKRMSISDPAKIESQVQSKQRSLERLAARYEELIALESPEYSVAALYRLGEMHEDFAVALFKAPAPQGASQVEVNQFKSTIDKVAFPLQEEAYKFYETAYRQSQEVETFTIWTRRTYDKMAQLQPAKHPEVVEQSVEPNYMVHRITLEPATKPLAY